MGPYYRYPRKHYKVPEEIPQEIRTDTVDDINPAFSRNIYNISHIDYKVIIICSAGFISSTVL